MRRRRSLLEQMVGWQRRALGSLCGRVDLLQQHIDRQAGAQTELESRLLDLERVVLGGCCPRCGSAVEGSAALAEAQWRADVNARGAALPIDRVESNLFSFDHLARGPVAR